ncbi:MAG TPA: GNAT family N-acetyltransferase [Herpetosiphonaceae bacterium]|nr:GNAT family N-acetyltransferase [Herpetosiphonaceae bacterium]
MSVQLVSPRSFDDYAAIARLHAFAAGPVSAEELHSADATVVPPDIRRRIVALDSSQAIVGSGFAKRLVALPGTFSVSVSVEPESRRRGIGAALYQDCEAFAAGQGATSLLTSFPDSDPAAEAFARRCGFELDQHWVYFALDLASFDAARFAAIPAMVEARGIRFLSLAEAGVTPENQRKLYELNRRTSLDAPGEDSFPSFEEFVDDICGAPWFRADAQIIAADGDEWVGLAAVGLEGALAHNAFTGVDRPYRRRQIAQALTLRAIEYARSHGAERIQVFNDSRNVAMLAMQETLGYRPIPGRLVMIKHLAQVAGLPR